MDLFQGATLVSLCQSLAAIGDVEPQVVASAALPDLLALLHRFSGANSGASSGRGDVEAVLLLCCIVLQTQVPRPFSVVSINLISISSTLMS